MADIKMNEFVSADDANYVYGELANGIQVKIKVTDLFSGVVKDRFVFEGDANNLNTPGIYYITGNTMNVANCTGLMIVFFCNGVAAQMTFNVFTGTSLKRVRLYNNGKWDIWSTWI